MLGIWQFSMNLIQMEEEFLSVWYALEIKLLNVFVGQHCLQHSQTFALKNWHVGAFPKLIIMDMYSYSP